MTEQKFKVGDKVRFAGTEGVVIEVDIDHKYSTRVMFEDDIGRVFWFGTDGKHPTYNDRLTLIERPKKLVKRVMWQCVHQRMDLMHEPIFRDEEMYETKEDALKFLDMLEKSDGYKSIGVVAVEVEMLEEGDV